MRTLRLWRWEPGVRIWPLPPRAVCQGIHPPRRH